MSAPLVLALAGTAHHPGVTPVTGTDLDPAIAATAAEAPERAILLAAGISAVSRLAGRLAVPAEPPRAASGTESAPVLTAEAATLIATLMAGECPADLGSLIPVDTVPSGEPLPLEIDQGTIRSLLPEAFSLIAQAGRRLSPVVLPIALDLKGQEIRAVLPSVLGERGRWLAAQNPDWAWVRDQEAAAASRSLPADAERLWQEGVLAERAAVLERLREVDPDQGRLWLTQTWKSEKADTRLVLMRALTVGISLADEPFLEAALDDRSERVRALAADLLVRLPDSALAMRMRTRAMDCLAMRKKLFGARVALEINPPERLSEDWQRDGILVKPPGTIHGPRAWWLLQLVSRVPPALWKQQVGAAPAAVIAITKDTEWHSALLEGWVSAAIAFKDTEWLRALWRAWPLYDQTRIDILYAMPPEMAEEYVLALLTKELVRPGEDYSSEVGVLPKPWNEHVSSAMLPRLRQLGESNLQIFLSLLDVAGPALHPVYFTRALEPWHIPELEIEPAGPTDYRVIRNLERGRRTLGQFLAVVALRRLMHQALSS
jgi:hypothetical protein